MLESNINQTRTVSQLTKDIKNILEGKFRFVTVSGEISNLRTPFSGHQYFTLKDNSAQIRAVLFKGKRHFLTTPLQDGQQVLCRGKISVYEPRGEYQIILDTVEQHGQGQLQLKFEQLKEKLNNEGLFDVTKKKKLPSLLSNIVLLSSPTGAAVHDFLKICKLRKTSTAIQIFPVPVQGDNAAPEITRAIKIINRSIPCDAIVLCRGGGSLEDLWPFNEELVARAIFQSKIPIVSGVGHEIDTTIADLCADLRAPTPTGAAEMIIPDTAGLSTYLDTLHRRIRRVMEQKIEHFSNRITQQHRLLLNFKGTLENYTLKNDLVFERFQQAGFQFLAGKEEKLLSIQTRLDKQAPLNKINLKTQKLEYLKKELVQNIQNIIRINEQRLAKGSALLQGVSPLSTLSRGYSIVQTKNKRTGQLQSITSCDQVENGDTVQIRLHKGKLTCTVDEKSNN